MKKLLPIMFLIISYCGTAFASGFQINEHGARAMAMGGAFTGLASDPSALFYNPAGLARLPGTHFMAGVSLIAPSSSFRGPSPAITEHELDTKIFTPFNFYVTHQLSDKLNAGIGVNNPYGLGTLWQDEWVGRFLAIETEIRTFFFTGALSYKLTENLSIGAGINYAYGDVIIRRNSAIVPDDATGVAAFDAEAQVNMEGDGTGIGFIAGLLYQPIEELSIGLSYRSEVGIDFEGDATSKAPSQFASAVPAGGITAPLTTPQNITFGVAVQATDMLMLTADFQYVGWSSYDKLEVTFEDVVDESGNKLVVASERDYDNSFIARLGGEYNLTPEFDLRGGFLYDSNPVKDERLDPTLPDADRLGLNIGFGYKLSSDLSIDVAYLFLRFVERKIDNSIESYTSGDAPFNGVYNSVAHLFGINFSYNL